MMEIVTSDKIQMHQVIIITTYFSDISEIVTVFKRFLSPFQMIVMQAKDILIEIDKQKKCSGNCARCAVKLPQRVYNTLHKTGIWLDFSEACLISLMPDGTLHLQHIDSHIEDYHPAGGAPAKTKYGAQYPVSEKKYLGRAKQQKDDYYQVIMNALTERNCDLLYLFGPAEAKVGLQKKIEQDKNFKPRLLQVDNAGQLTENQKIAQVKNYFAWDKK